MSSNKVEKKFIYLVQGQANLVANYFYLSNKGSSDAIFLTYDKEIDGAIYYPNSTWAEGRNLLLERALEKGEYLYYILLDDDLKFIKGSFELFEKYVLQFKPAVAYPVFYPKSHNTIFGIGLSPKSKLFYTFLKVQICRLGDAQLMAFHKNVIKDKLVFPLQVQFDKTSWWCTSSLQQLLIFNLYHNHAVQFNEICVINEQHREYERSLFSDIQAEWLRKQFRNRTNDPRKKVLNIFSLIGLVRLMKMFIRSPTLGMESLRESIATLVKSITYKSKLDYSFSRKEIEHILKLESTLYAQFMKTRNS